ncbi:MAG: oligoendopeptidase F [Mollicutes bacterium]|nr:oligoendopeptidase F [Mollicutes bacterium]
MKIDLKELFENDKEFEAEYNQVKGKIKDYSKYEGHLYDSADILLEFLLFDRDISVRLERLYLYAHINNDLDLSNTHYQNYLIMMMNLINEIRELSSFVSSELLSKDLDYFEKLIEENSHLKEFFLSMKKLFRNKKYIKSKEEEKIISILTSTYNKPSEISEYLINTDLKYGFIKEGGIRKEITNSNMSNFFESSNPKIRKDVFNKVYNEIKAHENTFASILSAEIINNNKIAKLRGFNSSKEYSLYQDEIDPKIYSSLIKGVRNNLDKFFKYFAFKKKALNLKTMHIYDTYANITEKYNKKYSLKEGLDIIINSLSILGKDYTKVLRKAFENNWMDTRIIKNKRSGAYCTCCYLTHPYVVTNYEEKLNDLSTIAHEFGHAMHYYYAQKNNSYQDYGYSIFAAEVASQVNEIILTDYLLENTNNKEEKKYLLDLTLQRFKATVVRQTMFAEFEDNLHNMEQNGSPLTKESITDEYLKLNKIYFGNNVYVDDKIKYECFRIPHFYYNFYVYQYSTGYVAAMKIANDIINGKKGALDKYLEFLKLGSTKNPIESLMVAGVDINNSKIYDEVFDVFEEKLKELKKLYE